MHGNLSIVSSDFGETSSPPARNEKERMYRRHVDCGVVVPGTGLRNAAPIGIKSNSFRHRSYAPICLQR